MVQGSLSLQLRIDATLENGSEHEATGTEDPDPTVYDATLTAGPVPAPAVHPRTTSTRNRRTLFFDIFVI
jgi:hypothetical protein